MKKEKIIALIILIVASAVVIGVVAVTRNPNFWHLLEVTTIAAALLFDLPGGLTAAGVAVVAGLLLLPAYNDYLVYARLILISGLIGWYVGREKTGREQLSRLLMVDRLTGLHNYSYFIDRLEEECRRADRFGSRLSLAMIDIDFFKPFNDKYGHRQGNEFLKKLAKVLKEKVRAVDIVCRYGGEEFAVIMPNTGNTAAEVAERLRQATAVTDFPITNSDIVEKKTISVGVATYPNDAEDDLQLIDRADEALYQAKQSGRNRVVVYKEPAPDNQRISQINKGG